MFLLSMYVPGLALNLLIAFWTGLTIYFCRFLMQDEISSTLKLMNYMVYDVIVRIGRGTYR
jgi:hypothetical protein